MLTHCCCGSNERPRCDLMGETQRFRRASSRHRLRAVALQQTAPVQRGGLLGSITGVLGGDWACVRYDAVISSLQERKPAELISLCREREAENEADTRSLFETQRC